MSSAANSTTGRSAARSANGAATVRAAALRLLDAVAPEATAGWMADRFGTPSAARARADTPELGSAWRRWRARGLAHYAVGDGPTVLLAHGWAGSAMDMATLAGALADAGFRALTFDMPAHGRSDGRRTTLREMTRALRDVATDAGPVVAVVAHSLGAAATVLALRDGLAARCAALLAPPRRPDAYLAAFARAMGAAPALARRTRLELERRLGPMACYDAERAATRLAIPGLVLHDAGDRQVPLSDGAAIAGAWARARLTVLQGLGHRRILHDALVVRDVVAFVRAHGDAAGAASLDDDTGAPSWHPSAVSVDPVLASPAGWLGDG